MDIIEIFKNILLQSKDILPRLIIFIAIFVIGISISIVIRKSILRILSMRMPRAIASNLSKAIYYVLIFLVAITALGAIGIDLTGFIIAGGFAGIVIGVALQPVLSNLFSGFYLMIEKTINVGEVVEISGNAGEVTEISPMFTRIRTFDGFVINISNTQIISGAIKNFSKAVARRIEFKIGIAYRENAEKAYEVIRRILDEHPYVLINPSPDIFVSNLGGSSVDITVRVWTPPQVAYDTTKDLLWRIKKALSEAGIEIPFTQVDIWFRSPLNIEQIHRVEEKMKKE
uniref:Mechanosensitive ion channel family protein n=1 Tax=Ignisphaera aggregans TaxID=334771 RepID=A0A7C5XH68_9CREN